MQTLPLCLVPVNAAIVCVSNLVLAWYLFTRPRSTRARWFGLLPLLILVQSDN